MSEKEPCACLLSPFSHVRLFVTHWTAALQAPPSVGFFRQEYWSMLPCPPPGDLPDPGIKPGSLTSPALAGGFSTTNTTWEAPRKSHPLPKPAGKADLAWMQARPVLFKKACSETLKSKGPAAQLQGTAATSHLFFRGASLFILVTGQCVWARPLLARAAPAKGSWKPEESGPPSLGGNEQACPISRPQCPHWSAVPASLACAELPGTVWVTVRLTPICHRDPGSQDPHSPLCLQLPHRGVQPCPSSHSHTHPSRPVLTPRVR